MPIWLRRFYIKKIEETLQAKKKAQEQANKAKKLTKPKAKPPIVKKR